MKSAEFKKLSTKYLSPRLKEKGWKGSGFKFYRTAENGVVHIFAIQGVYYGGSVCCETAVHFDFLPDLAGNIGASRINYASCLIRKRLSPKGMGDYHWYLSTSEDENIKSLGQIFEALDTYGEEFYRDFKDFPSPFDTLRPSDLLLGWKGLLFGKYVIRNIFDFFWLLKEINIKINRPEIAQEFSRVGMELLSTYYRGQIAASKSKKTKEVLQSDHDFIANRLRVD